MHDTISEPVESFIIDPNPFTLRHEGDVKYTVKFIQFTFSIELYNEFTNILSVNQCDLVVDRT